MKYHKRLKPLDKKAIILGFYNSLKDDYSMEEIAGVFNITKQYLSQLVIADKNKKGVK